MSLSFGYCVIDQLLAGKSVRDAVFESISYFKNNGDWEKITSESEFLTFNGKVAAFSPDLVVVKKGSDYTVYSFKVYCPDLIGSVYDADDPHPINVLVTLPATLDPNQTGFVDRLKQSFEDGSEIRDAIKFLYAPGESTFKPLQFKALWEGALPLKEWDPDEVEYPDYYSGEYSDEKYEEITEDLEAQVKEFEDKQDDLVKACESYNSFINYCKNHDVYVNDPALDAPVSDEYIFELIDDDLSAEYDALADDIKAADGDYYSGLFADLLPRWRVLMCHVIFNEADAELLNQVKSLVKLYDANPTKFATYTLFEKIKAIPGVKEVSFDTEVD